MTGRELIFYILDNRLEDTVVLSDNSILGLMNEDEAAAKFNVGMSTIRAWYICGMIEGTKIGENIYFLRNIKDPRKERS